MSIYARSSSTSSHRKYEEKPGRQCSMDIPMNSPSSADLKPNITMSIIKNRQNQMPDWSSLIRSYISRGSQIEALISYKRMRHSGAYSLGLLPLILKACASDSLLKCGESLHGEAVKKGVDFDVLIGTSLIGMYAKCSRRLFSSRKVFDEMPERTVVTWNAMISGCIRHGDVESAMGLFEKMPARSAVSWSKMIDGLAKGGDLVGARSLFDRVPAEMKNVVTWTVMVDGYVSKGDMETASSLFEAMPERNFFVWSSMVTGYFKVGDIKEAKAMFDRIPVRNLVNWNALICGYTQNGFCEEALEAFGRMQAEGFDPDEVTVVSVLSACAQLGRMDVGRDSHQMIGNKRMKLNEFVLNALIDMYAKCGDLGNARFIFDSMTSKTCACWNSLISGYAIHGRSKEALELFWRMEELQEKPDEITFLSVLSACAHGGFVDEGLEIFSQMERYGLAATIKHYGCVVDLLGRAGRLQDAYDLIKRMPVKPNDAVWGALLGACRIHSDTNIMERVMEEIGKLDAGVGSAKDPHSVLLSNIYAHHVLLSNIYAASDSWEKAERMRMVMMNKGLQKTPGLSSVMVV